VFQEDEAAAVIARVRPTPASPVGRGAEQDWVGAIFANRV